MDVVDLELSGVPGQVTLTPSIHINSSHSLVGRHFNPRTFLHSTNVNTYTYTRASNASLLKMDREWQTNIPLASTCHTFSRQIWLPSRGHYSLCIHANIVAVTMQPHGLAGATLGWEDKMHACTEDFLRHMH